MRALVQAQEHLTTATKMRREMDMRFWLEKAEAELKELAGATVPGAGPSHMARRLPLVRILDGAIRPLDLARGTDYLSTNTRIRGVTGRVRLTACTAVLPMTCPRCAAPTQPVSRFCSRCGAMLSLAPDSVGSEAPRHSLVSRLVAANPSPEGERKQLTILFADLRGSLELLAGRDPEEARGLLDLVIRCLVEAVHRYEGTVNQVMGDGIMALFGAPLAQEDHALRACRAALDMHAAIATQQARPGRDCDLELQVRIGINSGEVVVGFQDSDLRAEYTAVGSATHVAARMEQLATPGTTLITEATRRLAEGYVEVKPLGPITIKGLAEPVDTYELVAASSTRTRVEAARTRWSTRFLGRTLELASLRHACEHVEAGRGQIVAIVGEPGIGKSRLVCEFTRSYLSPEWLVLESGAVPYAKASAYLPVVNLLRAYLGLGSADGQSVVRERITARLLTLPGATPDILPPLLELLGAPVDDPAWRDSDLFQRRRKTIDAVCQVLVGHSRSQKVCLVVEDLQGIDSETQLLLDRFVGRVRSERILMIVTYRPDYAHAWSGLGQYAQIPVLPLPPEEAERLLRGLLGTAPDLSSLIEMLVRRAEGNPLFLEASVLDLVDARALAGEPGAYELRQPITTLHVPTTVQAVFAARIDRLSADDRRLLQCAAVIGRDVPVDLLIAVAGLGEGDVLRGLERLRERGFLYETAPAPVQEFSFSHILIQEVALASVLLATRRALDVRIVEALEHLGSERFGDRVERLAHHAERGEAWEKAVRYCREAGARAAVRSAHRTAVGHLERALTALARLPAAPAVVAQAVDVRLELRSVLIPLGEYRRTVAYLQEAETLARTLDDVQRLGLINSHLANYLHLTGELESAVERAQHALAIAEQHDDLALRVVTTAYLGFTCHTLGRYRDAAHLARSNIAALRGPLQVERFGMTCLPAVYSRTCLAWSLVELGEFDDADTAGHEALEFAERAEHSYSVVYACLAVGTARLKRGDFDGAAGVLERALRLCQALEIPVLLAMVTVPLVSAYANAGRIDEALRLVESIGDRVRRIGDPIGHWLRTGARAEVTMLAGRPEEAHPLAVAYLSQRRTIGAKGYEAWALILVADVTSELGSSFESQARAWYAEALELARRLEMRPLLARCRLGLGRLELRLGRRAEGKAALATAAEGFRAMAMRGWLQRVEQMVHAAD